MKFETRIVEYNKNSTSTFKLLKTLDILYAPVINQTLKMNDCEGSNIECIVVSLNDSIYEDIIYRYVEVVIL